MDKDTRGALRNDSEEFRRLCYIRERGGTDTKGLLMGGLRRMEHRLLEGKSQHRWNRSTHGRTEKNGEGCVNEIQNDRNITGYDY